MAETNTEKTLEQLKAENQALWQQLTKRNEQFMVGLDKILNEANYDEEKKHNRYNKMMNELVANQRAGVTARQLYGTVSECAENILQEQEDEPTRSPDWLIAVDGGLLLGSIFALISGITFFTADTEAAQEGMGIISLILNFVVGGIAMLIISKYTPNPDAPKGQRGYGKYIGATTLAMVLWMLTMTLTMNLIPKSLNMPLPPVAYLIIAAVGIGAKMYLKRKFRITGGLF